MNDKVPNQPQRDLETTELLTSYLDGELPDAKRIEVESRLNADQEFRAELQELQRTWDMLDELPRSEVKHSFTKSTLELVIKDATREAARERTRSWAWPLRICTLVAIPIFAFAFSNLVTDFFRNAEHRELVNNLPLIENVYYYETANDFEFLRALKKSGLFSNDDNMQGTRGSGIPKALINSRYRDLEMTLASYEVEQLDQLNRKKTKLDSFDAEQIEAIKRFHEQLKLSPDADELSMVLARYYNWLKTLDEETRTETMDTPAHERLGKIRTLRRREAERLFGLVGDTAVPEDDKTFVFAWMNGIVDSKRQKIQMLTVREMQKNREAIRRGDIRLSQRMRMGVGQAYIIDQLILLSPEVAADLVFEDIDTLKFGLSPNGQRIFAGRSEDEQKQLLLQWLRSAVNAQLVVTDEQLIAVYKTLPQEEKDELNNQDAEQRRMNLRRKLLSERARKATSSKSSSRPDILEDF